MRRAVVPVLLCLMVACSESFLPASAVDDLRVIGARIDVEGAPERANPSPEDEVQASILVIDQGPLPALTWSFLPCVPAPTRIGVPICGTLPEECDGCTGLPPSDPSALPIMRFQVPPEEKLDALEAREVLLLGVVCGEGVPSPEAIRELLSGESDDLAPCEDAEGEPIVYEDRRTVGRIVTVQIPIERDVEDPNLNPGIQNIFLNGSPWPPPYAEGVPREAPRTGCKAALDALSEEDDREKHPVAGSAASSINLSVTPESLQSFTIDGEDFTEEIQVSWLADGGRFEVAFSFITDPARSVLTLWQPSSEVPADGRLVRLNFVVRDGRGGLDRVERGLCVLPAAPAESPP